MGLPILCSEISDIKSGRSSLPNKDICFGEHSVGREEGEVLNDHLLCVRHLSQVRLLDPERKRDYFTVRKWRH